MGIDLGFLKNRLNLAADYYRRNNFDLIGVINTQGAGGTIAKYANIASMKSSGIELTISSKNMRTKILVGIPILSFLKRRMRLPI